MIHPSHSRRDLIEICEIFNIEILDLYDHPKLKLVTILEKELENIQFIDPENDYFFVEDIHELRRYLSDPNQSKNITVATKEKMIKDSRRIIAYCISGFSLYPHFGNYDEVYNTAMIVSQHCDISTCRRAIKLLNEDRNLFKNRYKIIPVISNRIKKQIERKAAVKKKTAGQFHRRLGDFEISFD